MAKNIRTRPAGKAPRVMDKAAKAPKELARRSILSAKEKAAETAERRDGDDAQTPEQYATDSITRTGEDTGSRAVNGAKNQVRRSVEKIRAKGRHGADTHTNAYRAGKERAVKSAKRSRQAARDMRGSANTNNKTTQKAASTAKNAVKKSAKGGVKTAERSVKTARNTVKTGAKTIKTTAQAARTSARAARLALQTAQKAAQAAKLAAKAAIQAAKLAMKAVIALVKLAIAAVKALIAAIAAGGWVVIVIILIIAIIAMLIGSAFGIFFSDESASGNSVTVSEAVTEINNSFQTDIQSQIDALTAQDTYDEVRVIYDGDTEGDSDVPNNWNDVLTVYAAKEMGEGLEVLTFDDERKAILTGIFHDMNKVSVRSEVITEEVPAAETQEPPPSASPEPQAVKMLIVYVTVDSIGYEQAAENYGFTADQKQMADEMMSPDYYPLFAELLGVNLTGGADMTQIISNLPPGEKGSAIVQAALTRVGHPYSQPKRGTGDYVDCSYFVWWAYQQAGVDIPSVSESQAKYCYDNGYNIGKAELQPGDLVFWSKLSCHCGRWEEIHHIGIYIGDNKVVEASSGKGRVVISELWGENGATWRIHSYGRPYV